MKPISNTLECTKGIIPDIYLFALVYNKSVIGSGPLKTVNDPSPSIINLSKFNTDHLLSVNNTGQN